MNGSQTIAKVARQTNAYTSLVAQKERNEKKDTHIKINHNFASAISSDDNALAAILRIFSIISVAVVLVHSFGGISAFSLCVAGDRRTNNK